jgi:Zn-dependent protease with chaperone function
VALLAALGYGYIALVLLATLGLVAGLGLFLIRVSVVGFAIQLLWAGLLFGIALARGLWVRFPSPEGQPLERSRHPELARLVEHARAELRAPRVHRVLLTGDLNAAVVQVPRLGLFGWPRNYLLLGLPLLDALSLEETRAVLAHELGHLSGADGRLGGWIYRTRAAWGQLAERLEHERHLGVAVLGRFFAWYQPYFDAYSFVAARAQERRADAWGARLAGARALADALARLPVLAYGLEGRFWPELYAQAVSSPQPRGTPFATLAGALAGLVPEHQAQASLELVLAQPTTHDDTHPCLRERLAALGEAPRLPPPPARPASLALLGERRAALAARLDSDWRQAVLGAWADRHQSMQRGVKRLARLDTEGGPAPRNAEKALELATLREEVHGREAALPHYRAALQAFPQDGPLRFHLARVLLELEREEGLELLRPLFEKPPDAVGPAHQLACEYWRRRGRGDEAKRHLEQALRAEAAAPPPSDELAFVAGAGVGVRGS